MTGEEKRRQLKEQYKQELLAKKEMLEKAKKLRKMQRINQALTEMNKAMQDDSDEWIQKLNEEAALSEAKLDLVLDSAGSSAVEDEKIEDLAMEAEKARLSAEEMVKQMKREMGLLVEEEQPSSPATSEQSDSDKSVEKQEENPASDKNQLPPQEKTLGDF